MWKVKFVSVFCDRVEVMYPRVAELNPYVQVGVSTCPLDDGTDLSFLRGYQVCSLHHLYHTTKVGSIYVCWLMFTFLCWYSVSCWRMLVWVCKRKWMNSAIPNSLLLQYVYFFLFKCPSFCIWLYMYYTLIMMWLSWQFIGCELLGVCARVFCDFGEEFEVSDATGEESKELFIQNITQVTNTLNCTD